MIDLSMASILKVMALLLLFIFQRLVFSCHSTLNWCGLSYEDNWKQFVTMKWCYKQLNSKNNGKLLLYLSFLGTLWHTVWTRKTNIMLCGLVFVRILELHELEKLNQIKFIVDLFVILNNGNPGLSFDVFIYKFIIYLLVL